jgi:peptide-methionine (S)-S-oxide reductase
MTKKYLFVAALILLVAAFSFTQMSFKKNQSNKKIAMSDTGNPENKKLEIATLANGCFWCTEAVFQQLKGVEKVTSGYSGGHVKNPTYEEVCGKQTGHAECLKIEYDPSVISFDELLEVFWATHDPTTLNRQGNDVGPQYRSVVFYQNEEQKEKAEKYKEALNKSGAFDKPIVTAIEPFTNFYPAEAVHKDYYKNNPNQSYCYYIIKPKLDKLKKVFANKLKPEYAK